MTNPIIAWYKDSIGVTDDELAAHCQPKRADIEAPDVYLGADAFVSALYARASARVTIFPDYDADGVCGGVVLYAALKRFGFDVSIYYPDSRFGYGLNKESAAEMLTQFPDTEVIVTVDNGASAGSTVAWLLETHGIETLVTDHHLESDAPTSALAYVNPNRVKPACTSQFHAISGAAVAWQMMRLYASRYARDARVDIESLMLFVGISTISDVMPLDNANRYFVKTSTAVMGDKTVFAGVINQTKGAVRDVLQALFRLTQHVTKDYTYKVNDKTFGFSIGPMLNAPRRMYGTSAQAFHVFTDTECLAPHIEQLEVTNTARKAAVRRIYRAAEAAVDAQLPFILYYNPEMPGGIAGLVAGRLAQRFSAPALAIGADGVGSGRSIGDFDLHAAMQAVSDYLPDALLGWGGHTAAVGCAVDITQLDALQQAFSMYTQGVSITLDAGPVFTMTDETADDLVEAHAFFERLRPFNARVPEPSFVVRAPVDAVRSRAIMGGGKHLRVVMTAPEITVIEWHTDLELGAERGIYAAGRLEVNEFQGTLYPQLVADHVAWRSTKEMQEV